MKILLYSDVHWSTTTSILRQRGCKYSLRLELLICGMNWAESLAKSHGCDLVICAGDFFDKSVLSDEEISALSEIRWNDLHHIFIVGNHESSKSLLQFSTADVLKGDNMDVVNEQEYSYYANGTQIHFIPYVTEADRGPLCEYLNKDDKCSKHIVISHNDIKGIRYGGFESKVGFSIDEIEECCDLYLNGHLHNHEWVTDRICNLGSLSAHNFTNDSSMYSYGCWILDTDSLKMDFHVNPYGLNFYKARVTKGCDIIDLMKNVNKDSGNNIIAVKCSENMSNDIMPVLKKAKSEGVILDYKLTIENEVHSDDKASDDIPIGQLDYLGEFIKCVHDRLGMSDTIEKELSEVCR